MSPPSRSALAITLLGLAVTGCTSSRVVLRGPDAGAPDASGVDAAPPVRPTLVSGGAEHTCLLREGALYCAGSERALGLGEPSPRLTFGRIGTFRDAIDLHAGYDFTCVLHDGGRLSCFGANARGQLGTGDFTPRVAPTDVFLPAPVATFDAGFDHACAILTTGALHCWGSNTEHECGQGEPLPEDRSLPVEVAAGTRFVEVAAGQGHTCAIDVDGAMWCWGRNLSGESGAGPGRPQLLVPERVGDGRYVHVVGGQNHSCAIQRTASGETLWCWGADSDNDGFEGPMNLPGSAEHFVPAAIGAETDWTALSTDTFHTCGLRSSGALWCWGRNAEGQLGVGDMSITAGAIAIAPEHRFVAIDVSRFHTCAVRDDGVVMCTGVNRTGELGVGDVERRASLTEVIE